MFEEVEVAAPVGLGDVVGVEAGVAALGPGRRLPGFAAARQLSRRVVSTPMTARHDALLAAARLRVALDALAQAIDDIQNGALDDPAARAMIGERVYVHFRESLDVIRTAGTQFDMRLVQDFCALLAHDQLELSAEAARRWLVGFSGGLDSTVLLHAMARLRDEGSSASGHGYGLRAVHIDHGLHADSPSWREHCEQQARSLQVELICASVSVRNVLMMNVSSPASPDR
mgnify:CR=1 FL=1